MQDYNEKPNESRNELVKQRQVVAGNLPVNRSEWDANDVCESTDALM